MTAWTVKNMNFKTILNVIYGLIGLYFFYDALVRLWQEGTFGNDNHILFFIIIGPQIGFLKLAASLFLTIGQVFYLLNKKYAIWFSRTSYLLSIMTLITMYLIFKRWYIWGFTVDFLIFSLIITVLYLPIIIRKSFTIHSI